MKTNNISFPHPVLGINKGVLPDLDPSDSLKIISIEETADSYVYTFSLKQENRQITQYIQEGYAAYVCEVDCDETLYKRAHKSKTSELKIPIKKTEIAGHVAFSFFVLTTRLFPGYTNSEFNKDYKDPETGKFPKFKLESGAPLVVFPSWSDNITTRFDNKPVVTSFIQIVKKMGEDKSVTIDLNDDIINVELPEEMFVDFTQFNNEQYVGLFYASLIQNALVKGILNIEENESRAWADSIRAIMEKEPDKYKEFSLEEPGCAVDIATAMLSSDTYGSPYARLFKCIKNLQD